MITTLIGAIIRTVLATIGGTYVQQGLVTSDQLQQAIGAIIFLGTLAWSIIQKVRATKKYNPNVPVRQGIPLE